MREGPPQQSIEREVKPPFPCPYHCGAFFTANPMSRLSFKIHVMFTCPNKPSGGEPRGPAPRGIDQN